MSAATPASGVGLLEIGNTNQLSAYGNDPADNTTHAATGNNYVMTPRTGSPVQQVLRTPTMPMAIG